jgi:hypothetical protein
VPACLTGVHDLSDHALLLDPVAPRAHPSVDRVLLVLAARHKVDHALRVPADLHAHLHRAPAAPLGVHPALRTPARLFSRSKRGGSHTTR